MRDRALTGDLLRLALVAERDHLVEQLGGVAAGLMREFGDSIVERFTTIYWMSLILAVMTIAATCFLTRSSTGISRTAMRDDEEEATAPSGSPVPRLHRRFLWLAPFLGLAGVPTTLQNPSIASDVLCISD